MKNRKKHNLLYSIACAILTIGVICQANAPAIYAVAQGNNIPSVSTSDTYSLKDELSKHGNPVTEYENIEDNQLKTILWTQGIEPPKMGGDDSQFKREVFYDEDGNLTYINYISPFIANKGWYDVNKSTNFEQNDVNLCFAAAAANSLHWWMDRNANNIDRYLEKNPDNERIQNLTKLRSSFVDQQHSGVYNIFRNQFAGKPDGYWSDLLQDQFLNGYYLNSTGGTNDSDVAREKLLKDGPDKHGGFFYEAFSVNRLSERRYYDLGFDALNREIKALLLGGNLILMTFTVGRNAHVVTLWGAEYDQNGNISAVYCTDSDDEASQGMVRYRLVNVGGKPAITTRTDGTSSNYVTCLQILSPGTKLWNGYFNDSNTILNLEWSNTDLTYNGQKQAPTVNVTNISPQDDVTVTVEGGSVNAGRYTATAKLSGADADKYELPQNATIQFEIKKAKAPTIEYPSASALEYGQKLSSSRLNGGSTEYGYFVWADSSIVPTVNNSGYFVNFVADDNTKQNYEPLKSYSKLVPVVVRKVTPTIALDTKVSQNEGTNSINLTATLMNVGYGKIPTGTVDFEVADENGTIIDNILKNVDIVNGVASITWSNAEVKDYTVKAMYNGNENYNIVHSNNIVVAVNKQSQVGFEIAPIDAKTYGDKEFKLNTIGGSGTGAITYESSDPSVIAITGDTASVGNAGTAIITATKIGDSIYNDAVATFKVVVNMQELRVVADSYANVVQGNAIPNLTYTVDGLVNADKLTDVQLIVSVNNTNIPGDYPIVIMGGNLTNAHNYKVIYVNGLLSIKEKEVAPIIPINPTKPIQPIESFFPSNAIESIIPINSVKPSKPGESGNLVTNGNIKLPVTDKEARDEFVKNDRLEDTQLSNVEKVDSITPNSSDKSTGNATSTAVKEENGFNIGAKVTISLFIFLVICATVIIGIWKKNRH